MTETPVGTVPCKYGCGYGIPVYDRPGPGEYVNLQVDEQAATIHYRYCAEKVSKSGES